MWLERCSRWLTLRAGVSRCAWMAAAIGLAFAGVESPRAKVVIGATGLVLFALVVAVIRSGLGRGRAVSAHGVPFLLIVLSLLAGASWGAVRVDAQLRGELASSVGARPEIVVEVIDSPRDRGDAVSFFARSLGPQGAGEHLLVEMSRGASGAGGGPTGSSADGAMLIQEGAVLGVRGLSAGSGVAHRQGRREWFRRARVAGPRGHRRGHGCAAYRSAGPRPQGRARRSARSSALPGPRPSCRGHRSGHEFDAARYPPRRQSGHS